MKRKIDDQLLQKNREKQKAEIGNMVANKRKEAAPAAKAKTQPKAKPKAKAEAQQRQDTAAAETGGKKGKGGAADRWRR